MFRAMEHGIEANAMDRMAGYEARHGNFTAAAMLETGSQIQRAEMVGDMINPYHHHHHHHHGGMGGVMAAEMAMGGMGGMGMGGMGMGGMGMGGVGAAIVAEDIALANMRRNEMMYAGGMGGYPNNTTVVIQPGQPQYPGAGYPAPYPGQPGYGYPPQQGYGYPQGGQYPPAYNPGYPPAGYPPRY